MPSTIKRIFSLLVLSLPMACTTIVCTESLQCYSFLVKSRQTDIGAMKPYYTMKEIAAIASSAYTQRNSFVCSAILYLLRTELETEESYKVERQ